MKKYLLLLFFPLSFISLGAKDNPELIKKADRIIAIHKLYTVMHKTQIPPSGDKHDYMSQGPYWWPDPSKPDGKPYIRKDGVKNPEIKGITDSDEMDELIDDVELLAQAFQKTKNEKYAAFASQLIKTWFIDPKTRQNPNLNFSQGIPGINTGRGIGIIETRFLIKITDAAEKLQASTHWHKSDHQALKIWFKDFLTWLIESPIGKDEADEHNNHGTYYDVQVINFAMFLGQNELAKRQLEITKSRMASQLKPDGSQPHELARTKSFGYSLMNLRGFFYLAEFAQKLNVDLWHYQTPEGATIKKCLDFLIPYIKKDKVWPYQQIAEIHWADTEEILMEGSKAFKDLSYSDLAKKVSVVSHDKFSPSDLVDPFLDSANSRWFFFNSTSRPFGMVNLSPDNGVQSDWGAGYRYKSDSIKCFSHIHGWQLSGIPVLPTTGDFKGQLGSGLYGSTFSHAKEIAKPGYHEVYLDSYKIKAQLTATTRVGFHKYTYPKAEQSQILFDFATFLGPSDTQSAYVKQVGDRRIEGYAIMSPAVRRPKILPVYFVVEFDKPFTKIAAWRKGKLEAFSNEIEGEKIGVYVSFPTAKNEERLMKVAISYVSTEQAGLNMKTEIPHWDFDRVAEESKSEWNEWLGRIQVEGKDEVAKKRFYTDLFHALQGRRIVSDVNGKYLDMTGDKPRAGQIPLKANGQPKFNHHNFDAMWGAQWTINTLWHLVYPEVTESFINSMLMMYDDGGLIPRGPAGGNYTYVMTGASSTPFIVSAYQKGIRGFDIQKAYEGMRKNHFPGGMMSKAGYEHKTFKGGGIEYYMERGYVPHPLSPIRYGFHMDGSAQTLEYAYQDFSLAQMSKALGKTDDYQLFMKRSQNYKNIWNPEIGWMWIKNLDGNWEKSVDILRYDHGWEEGNAAQWTWFVPHDLKGLANLMGGKDKAVAKLNESFEKASVHDFVSGKSHDKETEEENRRVYLNFGNQPSIQTSYIFNQIGAPWLTQKWTRKVIEKVYSGLSPNYGYSGDEDQGLMGSLAVLMKIGIFSMDGGVAQTPYYDLSSPIFDKIEIKLNPDFYPGKTILIETKNNSKDNMYIQQASFNGKPIKSWISHPDLIKGGKITYVLGANPNKSFGQ